MPSKMAEFAMSGGIDKKLNLPCIRTFCNMFFWFWAIW